MDVLDPKLLEYRAKVDKILEAMSDMSLTTEQLKLQIPQAKDELNNIVKYLLRLKDESEDLTFGKQVQLLIDYSLDSFNQLSKDLVGTGNEILPMTKFASNASKIYQEINNTKPTSNETDDVVDYYVFKDKSGVEGFYILDGNSSLFFSMEEEDKLKEFIDGKVSRGATIPIIIKGTYIKPKLNISW